MHTKASYELKLKLHNLQNKSQLVLNIKQCQFNPLGSISLSIVLFILKNQANVRNKTTRPSLGSKSEKKKSKQQGILNQNQIQTNQKQGQLIPYSYHLPYSFHDQNKSN